MQDTTQHKHTNRLAQETSPYLLQHAHNPVDWHPWGDEAFDSARAQNKLVLVSIGYSSCHWCHVMEQESFENEEMAAFMNEHFVCIKVDREERPDVDQVYMTAVQLMTGRGGWPLNCFTLPDGRPVYGGTYFPPDQWRQVMTDLSATWSQDPARVKEYAARLSEGVAGSELVALNQDPAPFAKKELADYVEQWVPSFDRLHGGPDRAPKFPMPNNLEFLLRYGTLTADKELIDHVKLTLRKMAFGGIYDQVGGGFARYSTDAIWKAPHFEKMLYDNAQLISVYSQAFQAFKDPLYEAIVMQSLSFLQREMTSEDGLYFSALDADSEGEEGLFYVWTEQELDSLLGADMSVARAWYDLQQGRWERDRIILLRTRSAEEAANKAGLAMDELERAMDRINGRLLEARSERIRPGLDDKALTSWNALMVRGLCDAYEAFGRKEHLSSAERTMRFLLEQCRRPDGGLWHSYKNGEARINGYLEDYCFSIEALVALYGLTFDESWLRSADELARYCIDHFQDPANSMFHFTSDLDPPLIARKMEVNDNVIPSSNSSMAKGLFMLGHLLYKPEYLTISEQMLQNVKEQMAEYPSGYSNWAQLMTAHLFPFYEIAITGPECLTVRKEMGHHFIPGRVFLGGATESALPLLEGKLLDGTTIFVCENKVCQVPVTTVAEAIKQMR
ncbi:MAG: thioredoxin domain-containing protein [Flavobacteriales bacterium]|nr:thioredoxin domain-containing protein [Flavobacteriales bacterium]